MKYITLAVVATFALSSVPVQAQLLDADITTGIDTSINASGTGAGASGDQGAAVRVDIGEVLMSEGATAEGEASMLDANASADALLEFSVMRESLSQDTSYGITESHEVRSAAGLESYAAASVRADERLDSVTVAENQMHVTYHKEARFLGFIPGSVKTDVSVTADGEVAVDYPWYAFLFAKGESEDDLAARIQAEIMSFSGANDDADTMMNATTTASASTGVQSGSDEVRYWAQVIESVHAALSADANASVQASA